MGVRRLALSLPEHRRLIATHLRDSFAGDAQVFTYKDDNGNRPIDIGSFGKSSRFHSTLGVSDMDLNLPEGSYEFATIGSRDWLANTLASSVYWLRDRDVDSWPLICEDVVRLNAKSIYRHMAYAPSEYRLTLHSQPHTVRWLLGLPIRDKELTIGLEDLLVSIRSKFPAWLTDTDIAHDSNQQ